MDHPFDKDVCHIVVEAEEDKCGVLCLGVTSSGQNVGSIVIIEAWDDRAIETAAGVPALAKASIVANRLEIDGA